MVAENDNDEQNRAVKNSAASVRPAVEEGNDLLAVGHNELNRNEYRKRCKRNDRSEIGNEVGEIERGRCEQILNYVYCIAEIVCTEENPSKRNENKRNKYREGNSQPRELVEFCYLLELIAQGLCESGNYDINSV